MCSITPKYIIKAVKEMTDGQPSKTITIADLREYADNYGTMPISLLLREDVEDLTDEVDHIALMIWRHCNLLERELSDELELSFSVKK